MKVIAFLGNPNPKDVFSVFYSAVSISKEFKACAVQSTITDIYAFCAANPGNCNSQKLFQNLSSNMFVLMAKSTELTELYKEFPSSQAEEFYEQTYLLGSDIGTVLRVVSGFKSK